MEYTIEHRTTYEYPDSVNESYTVLHLQPRSDQHQFCTRYVLQVTPRARVHSYADRYGNDVQHFAILPWHGSLAITTHSNVVTMLERDPRPPEDATRILLAADPNLPGYYDFLHPSGYVQFSPEAAALGAELGDPGERIGESCHRVSKHIH